MFRVEPWQFWLKYEKICLRITNIFKKKALNFLIVCETESNLIWGACHRSWLDLDWNKTISSHFSKLFFQFLVHICQSSFFFLHIFTYFVTFFVHFENYLQSRPLDPLSWEELDPLPRLLLAPQSHLWNINYSSFHNFAFILLIQNFTFTFWSSQYNLGYQYQ